MSELAKKKCVPCEGGVAPLSREEAERLVQQTPAWRITPDGKLRRDLVVDFPKAIDLFVRVCAIAEGEGHHPDLHLVEYRRVAIEIWTHAAGGLTENDFILAAKIDATAPPG